MPRATGTKPARAKAKPAKPYKHPEADSPMRPEVGTQAQFKKKLPPKTYKYESSLSPTMDWDGQNPAREQGEALVRQVLEAESLEQAKAAASKLKAMSKPFLNWAGKAERLSFDVPSLPLFILQCTLLSEGDVVLYKLSIVACYLQEVLMRRSLNRQRVAQLKLFHPRHQSPAWQGLPRETRLRTVRLFARLLREHSGKDHASGSRKEAGDE